jgi:hypothetical protein
MTFLLASLLLAAGPEAPDLAMMDMKAVHGVEDSLAAVLNESFLVALKNSGRLGSVFGGSDLRAMLDLEQQKQALGCGDDGCLAELGGALGVPYLFYTSLATVGSKYIMHYKVMAVEDAKVVARGMKVAKSEDELLEIPQLLVDQAMSSMFQSLPKAAGSEKPVPPKTATPSKPGKPIKWSRWAGVGLSLAGAGTAFVGRGQFNEAKEVFRAVSEPRTHHFATYNEASKSANILWLGGLGAAVVGAGLAVVAP